MNTQIKIIIALIVGIGLAYLWSLTSPIDEELSQIQSDTFSPISSNEGVRRRPGGRVGRSTQEGKEFESETRISFQVIDHVSGEALDGCHVKIANVDLEMTIDSKGLFIQIPSSTKARLTEIIEDSSKHGQVSVGIGEALIPLAISNIELRANDEAQVPVVAIIVDRFARLTVSVVGGFDEVLGWSCRVLLCPPIPEGLTPKKKRLFEHKKRMPKSYRRSFGRKIPFDFDESLSSESIHEPLRFLVDRSGEFFVQAFLNDDFWNHCEIRETPTGLGDGNCLGGAQTPVVGGVLLDVEGNPVPINAFESEGKARWQTAVYLSQLRKRVLDQSGIPICLISTSA